MAAFALFGTFTVIMILVVYVLLVVAEWKIFMKAGEPWWKCLIPVYNLYILFKISWQTSMFWLMAGFAVLGGFLSGKEGALAYLGWTASLISSVILFMNNFKLARAFGRGTGFAIGLLLLPNIFTLILGFGGDIYIGPQK